MQTVSDIVALPPLREDRVVRACDEAIQFKQQTIEKLVQFDILQTKALAPIESLLQSIMNQIQFMEDVFIQGDTSIHVNTTAVEGLSCGRPETAIKEKKAWYEISDKANWSN